MNSRHAFLIALLLIAANLRAAITGVGPVLEAIRADLALTAAAAGILASLPVLMFAAFAPLARLAGRYGAERMILGGLLVLIAGLLLRSAGAAAALFAGTVVLAIGIASTNVLLPVVIKQRYPQQVPSMTMAYATVMGAMAALASGVTIPLAQWLPGGWRTALASWVVLALAAWFAWLPHARRPGGEVVGTPGAAQPSGDPPRLSLWRTPVAWYVTGFMGLQSTIFYVAVNWFPAILRDAGISDATAGWLLTLYQVAALLAGMAVPQLIRRYRDQRTLAAGMAMLSLVAIVGILVAPGLAVLWVIVLGCGSGPSLILALSFIGLRASNHESAARLSLLAQGGGYLFAGFGPVVFGLAYDYTGGWTLALLGVAGIAVGQALCGFGAGRSVKV